MSYLFTSTTTAKGDGISDDRSALQALFDNAQPGDTVCFGRGASGVYRIGQGAGYFGLRIPAGVVIEGGCLDAIRLLQAPGIGPSVKLLQADAPGSKVQDIILDGNLANQLDMDEHRAGYFGTAADLQLLRVIAKDFTGDGLTFYTGADRFVVDRCEVRDNHRDGLAIVGRSSGGKVRDSKFIGSRAQQIDCEPGAAVVSDLTITGCTMDGAGKSTDYVLTISGGDNGNVRATGWRVERNTINGGTNVVWANDIKIVGNRGVNPIGLAHVRVYRRCDNIKIVGNEFDSSAANIEGTVLVQATAEGGPHGVLVQGNELRGDTFGVRVAGGCSAEILDNEMVGPGKPTGGPGVYLNANLPNDPLTYAVVARNRIRDFGPDGVRVDGRVAVNGQLNKLVVADNIFDSRTGSMPIAMRLNNDGSGCAKDIRVSGNTLLGGCSVEFGGPEPAGSRSLAGDLSGAYVAWKTP